MITHVSVEEGWLLIAYDITGNVIRNKVRRKLQQIGSMPYTQSVFMIPNTVQSKQDLMEWSRENGVRLAVFNTVLEDLEIKDINSRYKKWLKGDLEEVGETAQHVWEELKEVEEALGKDDGTRINGLYKKVDGVANRFTHISAIINRYGNKDDEFRLETLHATVEKLKNRLDRIREMKLAIVERTE